MIHLCYFCNQGIDSSNNFCNYCGTEFNDITHVYTSYQQDTIDFAAFTYGNEYRIYINTINTFKKETRITGMQNGNWETILIISGEPLNFKNIKDKLPIYLTFS